MGLLSVVVEEIVMTCGEKEESGKQKYMGEGRNHHMKEYDIGDSTVFFLLFAMFLHDEKKKKKKSNLCISLGFGEIFAMAA